jgi:N-dimethylarginine dimethylaminohydrolase
LQQLRRSVEREYLIEIALEDALAFACNSVEIGDALVMHHASPALRSRLNAAGYRIFQTDLGEFHKAGGSAKCLTLRLDDGPAQASAAA